MQLQALGRVSETCRIANKVPPTKLVIKIKLPNVHVETTTGALITEGLTLTIDAQIITHHGDMTTELVAIKTATEAHVNGTVATSQNTSDSPGIDTGAPPSR